MDDGLQLRRIQEFFQFHETILNRNYAANEMGESGLGKKDGITLFI